MFLVQLFSGPKTLNAQRSTLNAQWFSIFSVGRWRLDIARCPAIPRRGGRAVDCAGLENRPPPSQQNLRSRSVNVNAIRHPQM